MAMWDAFLAWFQSPAGQRVLDAAVIPALAILVAGLVAGLIGRAAVRSVIARTDRDAAAGAVAALVDAARVLAAGTPQGAERERIERLRTEADVRLRLSGLSGAATAAEWASLRLDAIERDAASPVPQTRAAVDEVRERLLAWLGRPRRSKRLFGADVERLGAERAARGATRAPEAASAPPEAPVPADIVDAESPRDGKQEPPQAAPPVPTDTEREPSGDSRPEPVAARAQNLAHELQAERAKTAARAADPAVLPAAPAAEAPHPPTTEPVLIQRTRLDSMERQSVDHARHGRPAELPPAVAVAAPEAQPPATEQAEPVPVPDPEPAPVGERQPTPAWLDTYDDEAEVTRDIDLSRTPPPKAASAVRDRTRTGDDIVPRH
jgi:hypothetical protein